MKTATQFFSLMIALFIISMAGNANAQGRGQQKGHGHDRKHDHHKHYDHRDRHDHKDDDDHDHKAYHGDHKVHRHDHRRVVHPVVKHRHVHPVVVRHYHSRARYVYYRDYNVYHDLHTNVYISYSGRNWNVSASLPVALHRVDMRRAARMEVDYYQDDFPHFLERERPLYREVYTAY